MSRCRILVVSLFFVAIVPRLAHGDVKVSRAVGVGTANVRALQNESDPRDSESCASLGQLDISFGTDGDGAPKVGVVVTDPRGRKIGYDPLTKKAWDEVPEAGGRIVCDPVSDVCRGRIEVCGPVSGAFKVEVIGQRTATYSLSVCARSQETHDGKGLGSSDSAADLNKVAIQSGARDVVMVQYSRDREQRVAVQRQQPIRAGDETGGPTPAGSGGSSDLQ